MAGPWTVVCLHAHPDDEALLTGGTLARLAAEGHRVVLVVATDGAAGLADTPPGVELAVRRSGELAVAAQALGVARVVQLGYADSGDRGDQPGGFATASVNEAARRLSAVLDEERADVLISYDEEGGYGHPDHRQVHRAGAVAARTSGTPVLLEATIDADLLRRVSGVLARLPGIPASVGERRDRPGYTPRERLTHRVDVRPVWAAKRAAMAAHTSQAAGPAGSDARTLGLLLRLPAPVFRAALGFEWFVEVGRRPRRPLLDDVFASLRAVP